MSTATNSKGNGSAIKARDFATDQDVRWCPGCGNYAILNQVRKVLAKVGTNPDNTVFVSGIGCSSRFPYYMNTYGMHSIHGRAPAIATGLKIANPDLNVWIVTGDGDGLSIGGNHMLHILRRNLNVKILLFNNQIYGLTKGQYSPTSEEGKKTKSSPTGSIDLPITPTSFALAAEASFVARAVDVDKDLPYVLERAATHRGSAFIEIYQDCAIFNHGAFKYATDKAVKEEHVLRVEHGKPFVFGNDRDHGVWLDRHRKPKVVRLGEGITEDDLLVHDETDESMAFLLSRLFYPDFPEPIGVLYAVEDDCYEDLLQQDVADAIEAGGKPDLADLFDSDGAYTISS